MKLIAHQLMIGEFVTRMSLAENLCKAHAIGDI